MFLQFPAASGLQDLALIINTVLLIVFIVIAELGFTDPSSDRRARLRYVYPFIAVLVGLLIFAAYYQKAAA